MFIYLFFVCIFICSFTAQIYYLYRYYLRNQLAFDWINFFSKNLSFNKTCNDIVFKGINSHQIEAKRVKLSFYMTGISLISLFASIYFIAE